jgi:hypothetical protein
MSMRPGPGGATGASLQALVPALLARACPPPAVAVTVTVTQFRPRSAGHRSPVTGHGARSPEPGHGCGHECEFVQLATRSGSPTKLPRSFLLRASRLTDYQSRVRCHSETPSHPALASTAPRTTGSPVPRIESAV